MKSSVLSDADRTDGATNGIAEERIVLRIVREALRSESPKVRFASRGVAA